MHTLYCPNCPDQLPRPRGRVSPWLPIVLVAAVIAFASLASALTPDTRDFKARHGTVLTSHAL